MEKTNQQMWIIIVLDAHPVAYVYYTRTYDEVRLFRPNGNSALLLQKLLLLLHLKHILTMSPGVYSTVYVYNTHKIEFPN